MSFGLTSSPFSKEITSKITSKGQVTIPIAVRKHLGLKTKDKISFLIFSKGEVCLKAPRYPSVKSLSGAAGKLKKSLSWTEIRRIAQEDRMMAKLRRKK
ncbi:MAG: type II toxin-antitoxin system PrlF family antitoxin [bacterium]|nr:type II toxin-antitoxin system PrlF family antitoxin [bacterium]